jgi:hypothetical protein
MVVHSTAQCKGRGHRDTQILQTEGLFHVGGGRRIPERFGRSSGGLDEFSAPTVQLTLDFCTPAATPRLEFLNRAS